MNGMAMKGIALWVVIEIHGIASNPITHTPSSDVNAHADEIADAWAQLCGWKELSSSTDLVVSKLRNSIGALDGSISVSCEEPPGPVGAPTTKVLEKPEPPPKYVKQVIFVEIPEPTHMVQVYQPPPPRVVIYVLPPEESHVFNILDMRQFEAQEPVVHFLSGNGIAGDENARLARGVAPQSGDPSDFEIIPAISYYAD